MLRRIHVSSHRHFICRIFVRVFAGEVGGRGERTGRLLDISGRRLNVFGSRFWVFIMLTDGIITLDATGCNKAWMMDRRPTESPICACGLWSVSSSSSGIYPSAGRYVTLSFC